MTKLGPSLVLPLGPLVFGFAPALGILFKWLLYMTGYRTGTSGLMSQQHKGFLLTLVCNRVGTSLAWLSIYHLGNKFKSLSLRLLLASFVNLLRTFSDLEAVCQEPQSLPDESDALRFLKHWLETGLTRKAAIQPVYCCSSSLPLSPF